MSTFEVIAQFARMLRNLDVWLQNATDYAKEKGFEPEVLVEARLAPDQYPLRQQIQSACDAAKYAAAYLSGQKPPSHPDTEKTLSELRARVAKCLEYLDGFKASDFDGAEERRIAPAWMQGASVSGKGYTIRIAVPNFYFHVTTAYAILRHNGVAIGKREFIGVQKDWTELDIV